MIENPIWSEQFRPTNLDDCILPEDIYKTFKSFVDKKEIPNLILTGQSGIGKTTAAKALINDLNGDSYIINGSLNGNIDTLRNDIKNYASAVSFSGKRKYVILDEADYLNANSTQPALRNFIEEYSINCGFILTCNYINRIIPALQSRTSIVEFKIPAKEKPTIAEKMFKRIQNILFVKEIEYDDKALAQLIIKYFPDFRRTINELQRYSATTGKIDIGILAQTTNEQFEELVKILKTKNFPTMRKWVGENFQLENAGFFTNLFEYLYKHIKKDFIPQLVVTIAEYDYKSAFVQDKEINIIACLTIIMSECEFI
jgi:DNA polymerase III delta prime subunit